MELLRPDGCRLVYETHGDPSASALLLVEGAGGDIPGWGRNIPALSRDHFVIAYDQRGNGWSDATEAPGGMLAFVDDAVALLDHLSIDRAHVYGQSFGGMVAIELGLAHPARVRSLVLAATHAGGTDVITSTVPKGDADNAIFAASFVAEHPDDVAELYRVGVPQDPAGGSIQWEAMQSYAVGDRLGELVPPVLVLHGDADRIISVENARFLAAQIEGAELVVLPGAGHVYQWEQPQESDRAVLAFLARHDG